MLKGGCHGCHDIKFRPSPRPQSYDWKIDFHFGIDDASPSQKEKAPSHLSLKCNNTNLYLVLGGLCQPLLDTIEI